MVDSDNNLIEPNQIQAASRTRVQRGNTRALQILLKLGIDVNHTYELILGTSLLHMACRYEHVEMAHILLQSGADITKPTIMGLTVLHIAASKKNATLLTTLLEHNAEATKLIIDAKMFNGDTALHIVAEKNCLQIIKHLLMGGATYDIKDNYGKTPKDKSRNGRCHSFFQLLDELFEQVKNGDKCVIPRIKSLTLYEKFAVCQTRNSEGKTLLTLAEKCKHKEIVTDLLSILNNASGLDITHLEEYYTFKDVLKEYVKTLEILRVISYPYGPKLNRHPIVTAQIGRELLYPAVNLILKYKHFLPGIELNQHLQVIEDASKYLGVYPIDHDTPESDKKYMKFFEGSMENVRIFLNFFENEIYLPAKIFTDEITTTLLDLYAEMFLYYCENLDLTELEKLYERIRNTFLKEILLNTENLGKDDVDNLQKYGGCDENTANEIGNGYVNKTVLNLILNAHNYEGSTPMHLAAKNGCLHKIKFLLEEGANYNIKDYQGQIPIDVTSSDNADIIKFLTLVHDIFNNINAGNLKVIEELKNLNEDDFLAVTNARDHEGKSLISILLTNANGDHGKDSEKILQELIKLLKH